MLSNQQIAFIGGGHIAGIIIRNLTVGDVLPAQQIIVSEPVPSRRQHLSDQFGVSIAAGNVDAIQRADLILICVRPGVVKEIIPDLQAARLRPDQVIISIAAGIPLSTYQPLGDHQPVARALPNPPSQVGQGIAPLVFSAAVRPEKRALVWSLFGALGEVVEVEESYIDAITSLSSPVTTYHFFQSLIEAGMSCGLPEAIAKRVAAQTIIGSMAVWQSLQVPPTALISEASTPGGVSVKTLQTLEQHHFKSALIDAIVQGAARSTELGQASTGSH